VEGLTTAATVWVTAAVGIACGLAAWKVVLVAVAFALFLLALVRGPSVCSASATIRRSDEASGFA
jgi:uncharacterized membrane protein YhiD involved in acid resistance